MDINDHSLNFILEIYKLIILLGIFSLSAFKDIKEREVEDFIWILLVLLTLPVTLLQIFYFSYLKIEHFIIALTSCFLFGLLLFYFAKFGGADAKAIWVLPIVFPTYPQTGYSPLLFYPPIFPLSIVINSVLISSFYIFINIFNNLYWYINKKELFEKNLKLKTKIILFLVGEKINKEKLEKNKYYVSLFLNKNGKKILDLYRDLREFDFNDLNSRKGYYESNNYWAEKVQPFLVYVLIGIIVTLFLGDIMLSITSFIVKLFI